MLQVVDIDDDPTGWGGLHLPEGVSDTVRGFVEVLLEPEHGVVCADPGCDAPVGRHDPFRPWVPVTVIADDVRAIAYCETHAPVGVIG